ncbi:MAG: ComEC/Rec2 family competence protein [Chlamydiota bacterium]
MLVVKDRCKRAWRKSQSSLVMFWKQNPLLFFSVIALFGMGLKMHFSWTLLWITVTFALFQWERFLYSLPLLVACFFYAPNRHPFEEAAYVQGIFYPSRVEKQTAHFRKGWILQGTFVTRGHSVSARVSLRKLPRRISPFVVEGICKNRGDYQCSLFPKKPVQLLEPTFASAFVQIRFRLTQKIDRWIFSHVPSMVVAQFLRAFFLGKKEDLYLNYSFQTLGLSHILAISGFHFALFAAVFFTLFSLLVSIFRAKIYCLVFVSVYALLLQNSPSSFRAFILISLVLFSDLFGKKVRIYNLLGACLLIALLLDPTSMQSPSLQLSYLSCFALLLFYAPIFQALERCFYKKTPLAREQREGIKQPFGKMWVQTAAQKWSFYLKSALSASLAIYFLSAPLVLARFSSISFASLLYNLFVPILLGGLMGLWAILWPLCFHPYAAFLLTCLTEKALNICLFPPVFCKNLTYLGEFSSDFALTWVSLLLFIGFTLQGGTLFRYDIE